MIPGRCYFAFGLSDDLEDLTPWILARAARTWGFVYVFNEEIFVEEMVPL